ncbi:MAG: hypothetical protein DMF77_04820 [Acidobacteria bacterium]|nr:MAG: hypothetical protein DMF77_04820 [Acidobacteriota bacterium]
MRARHSTPVSSISCSAITSASLRRTSPRRRAAAPVTLRPYLMLKDTTRMARAVGVPANWPAKRGPSRAE